MSNDKLDQATTASAAQREEDAAKNVSPWSRRGFLQSLGGAAGIGLFGSAPTLLTASKARADEIGPTTGAGREADALQVRLDAAAFRDGQPLPSLPCNDDEATLPDRIGNFSKTMPHNRFGEVRAGGYNAFLRALQSGDAGDFNAIPGGPAKLANPRAAYAFCMAGADSHKLDMPAVHSFSSARQASEAGEVYWQAVTRDILFEDFDSNPLTQAAASDMSRFSDFSGPRGNGNNVTTRTLFRGQTRGDLRGPYITQFLYLPIPYGNRVNDQLAFNPVPGDDFMTSYDSWLAIQRGGLPNVGNNFENRQRFITTGRDLTEFVHRDFSFQVYLNAALICLGFGPGILDLDNPYNNTPREGGFITFGPAAVLDLVSSAAIPALRAAWFHKWLVHRKLRPEAFGGRLHNHIIGDRSYPIDSEILDSPVLDEVFSRHGTYLLPQAFPEGSPTHPSYPAGHAVIAGACVTVLKAVFEEDFVIRRPLIPTRDGRRLRRFGGRLRVGDELNKLASNIALGRNTAGVHWRADGDDGLVLGEAVAISLLQDYLRTVTESFAGFTLRGFDNRRLRITADNVTRN